MVLPRAAGRVVCVLCALHTVALCSGEQTLGEDTDRRGSLVEDALTVLEGVEKLRSMFAMITSKPLNLTFRRDDAVDGDGDVTAYRFCLPFTVSRSGDFVYCCPRWGVKEVAPQTVQNDWTRSLKGDLVLSPVEGYDKWELTTARACNMSSWIQNDIDDDNRFKVTWKGRMHPDPGESHHPPFWRLTPADVYSTLGDGSALGPKLGMTRAYLQSRDELLRTVAQLIDYFPSQLGLMKETATDYQDGLASSIWWEGISMRSFKVMIQRSKDSMEENQARMEAYGFFFRIMVGFLAVLFFLVVRVQRVRRVRVLRGFVQDLAQSRDEQQCASAKLLEVSTRRQRLGGARGLLRRATSIWRGSVFSAADLSAPPAGADDERSQALRMVTVPEEPLKEFFPIPLRYFFLDILCCGCCCSRRVPRKLEQQYPDGPPRTLAGRITEWVRSAHVWILVDTHSSRVRWPLLAALHMTLVLRRTWGFYVDINSSPNPQEEYRDLFFASWFADHGLSFDLYLYFRYLVFCILDFLRDSLLFAGNSPVHSSRWLLVGFIMECVLGYYDYLIDEKRIADAKDSDEYGARVLDVMDSVVGLLLHAVVGLAFLRLWVEEHRRLPCHLSEVEKASFLYVRHRLSNEKKQVMYRCKLCLPDKLWDPEQKMEAMHHCERCTKRREAGDGRLCGEELLSPMDEARHWQGHHCGKQPTTKWTEPVVHEEEKIRMTYAVTEVLKDALLPSKRQAIEPPIKRHPSEDRDDGMQPLSTSGSGSRLPVARGRVVSGDAAGSSGSMRPEKTAQVMRATTTTVAGKSMQSSASSGSCLEASTSTTMSDMASCSIEGTQTMAPLLSVPEDDPLNLPATVAPKGSAKTVRIQEPDVSQEPEEEEEDEEKEGPPEPPGQKASDRRRRLPIFMSTLMLLSIIPPAIMMRPSIVKDIIDAYNYYAWCADVLTFGDSFWMIVGGVDKTEAQELRRIGRDLSTTAGEIVNDTTATSMAVTRFMVLTNPDARPILRPLAGMVYCCGSVMAATKENAPACEQQVVDIVDGLMEQNATAQGAAKWISDIATDRAVSSAGDPPAGADHIKYALVQQELRGHVGYACHEYAHEWTKSMLGIGDDGVKQPTARENVTHAHEVLATRSSRGDPVAVELWRFMNADQFVNASRRLTVLVGNNGAEETAAAVHGALAGMLPYWLQQIMEPVLVVAVNQIKHHIPKNYNDTMTMRDDILQRRDVILHRALPIIFWGTVVGKALGTCYVALLLKWLVESYCVRFSEQTLAISHRSDHLTQHHNVGREGIFEGTCFPGYVLSTCYLSFLWVEFWTKFWFGFAAMMTIDSFRESFFAWLWDRLKLFLLSWFVKAIVLQRIIFTGLCVDAGGEIRAPILYSLMFPAFIICNFVIGVYFGVYRAVIGLSCLIVKVSRCDQLLVPQHWQDSFGLDWAYGSFLKVIELAEREYNPAKRMAMKCFGGEHIYNSWITRTTKDQPPSVDREVKELQRRARVRNRWHLYLTLIRNPILQLERKHRLKPPPPPPQDAGGEGRCSRCGSLCGAVTTAVSAGLCCGVCWRCVGGRSREEDPHSGAFFDDAGLELGAVSMIVGDTFSQVMH